MEKLVAEQPQAEKFIKKLLGSQEFINGQERFCIWISDDRLAEAKSIPQIAKRITSVREARLKSEEAEKFAGRAHQFREFLEFQNSYVIVPKVSSERREYVPIGYVGADTVITDKLFAVDDPELWVFAVLNSKIHNVWVRAVGGRLRTDISYSSVLCYNTFPIPLLTDKQKDTLVNHAVNVLAEREKHYEKTIAELYDPDKMPAGLLQAHRDLDAAIERCYRSKPFGGDEERLEYLIDLYEKMIQQKEPSHA